jgi:hypothetical protein
MDTKQKLSQQLIDAILDEIKDHMDQEPLTSYGFFANIALDMLTFKMSEFYSDNKFTPEQDLAFKLLKAQFSSETPHSDNQSIQYLALLECAKYVAIKTSKTDHKSAEDNRLCYDLASSVDVFGMSPWFHCCLTPEEYVLITVRNLYIQNDENDLVFHDEWTPEQAFEQVKPIFTKELAEALTKELLIDLLPLLCYNTNPEENLHPEEQDQQDQKDKLETLLYQHIQSL